MIASVSNNAILTTLGLAWTSKEIVLIRAEEDCSAIFCVGVSLRQLFWKECTWWSGS